MSQPRCAGRRKIAAWGSNVYVKIPVTNTRNEFMGPLIHELSAEGVKLNVTALLTLTQVRDVAAALVESVPAVVSVFAGRIADTGVDPEPIMRASRCCWKRSRWPNCSGPASAKCSIFFKRTSAAATSLPCPMTS